MQIDKKAAFEILNKYFDENQSRALVAAMIVKSAVYDVAETQAEFERRAKDKTVGDVTSAGVTEYAPKDQTLTSVAETPEQIARRGESRTQLDASKDPTVVRTYQSGEEPADYQVTKGEKVTKEGPQALATWADAASDILQLGLKLPDLPLKDSERKILGEAIKFLEAKVDEINGSAVQRVREEDRKRKEEEKALTEAERLYEQYEIAPRSGTKVIRSQDIWNDAVSKFEKTWGKGQEGFDNCVKDLLVQKSINDAKSLCAFLCKRAGVQG